jgi:hypothetical protein
LSASWTRTILGAALFFDRFLEIANSIRHRDPNGINDVEQPRLLVLAQNWFRNQ